MMDPVVKVHPLRKKLAQDFVLLSMEHGVLGLHGLLAVPIVYNSEGGIVTTPNPLMVVAIVWAMTWPVEIALGACVNVSFILKK